MRLLNVHTKQLHTFYGNSTPKYAILSHTWLADHEEVTFPHLQSQQPSAWSHLRGARKVDYTCQQAANDGYEWAWIDTCCIDKTNNAELSEAINSMFQWYQRAQVCYVFLLDVDPKTGGDVFTSRWWSRAWTLQELVAPANVQFFDGDWRKIGSKSDFADEIALKKSIDSKVLHDSTMIYSSSIAQRMCWAAQRQATREEDLAYALLGIFNINMTMQYGEGGEKAFIRLQKEIMRTTKDMSIFAWGFKALPLEALFSDIVGLDLHGKPDLSGLDSFCYPGDTSKYGLLASGPSDFAGTHNIVCLPEYHKDVENVETEEERYGVQTLKTLVIAPQKVDPQTGRWMVALLPCVPRDNPHYLIGIHFFEECGRNVTRRAFIGTSFTCLIRSEHTDRASLRTLKIGTRDLTRGSGSLIEASYFSRTLVIATQRRITGDFPDLSFHEILKPTPWENDQPDPSRFIIRGEPSQVSALIRFHNERAPFAVYLYLQDKFEPWKRVMGLDNSFASDWFVAAFPYDPMDQLLATPTVLDEIDAFLTQLEAKGTTCKGSVECSRFSCHHDKLSVEVTTTITFNQALTTVNLTFARIEEENPGQMKRHGLWRSMSEREVICMNRWDWITPAD